MINKTVTRLMLSLLILLSGRMANAQSPYFQAVTNLNPVGYWPMHETTPPSVQGNIETNYGTLGVLGTGYYPDWINPSSTAIKRQAPGALVGDSDTAVYFTGAGASNRGSTTNSIYIPRTSPLTTLVPPFTVECWFYPTNNNQNDIWGQSGAAGLNNGANWGGMRLYWNPGFIVYCYDGQSGSTLRQLGSATGFTPGQWYHVVVTADANTNVTLYVNDALQFTTAAAGLYSPDFWTPFQIGCSRGNSRAVAGIIDEFAIYTNDLSAATVETHYINGTNGTAGQYKGGVLANNPLIYFQMNAPTYTIPSTTSWNVMTNYGSSVGDGLYTPGTIPGVVAGPSRSGIPFAGLPVGAVPQLSGVSSFGVITNTPSFNPTGLVPFTVSAMFRGNPMDVLHGTWETIVGHSDSSWRISMNVNGKLQSQLGTNGTSGVNSSIAYNDGSWHQVVSVYTPGATPTTTGTNALYIDGVLDAISTTVTTNGILPGSSLNVFIGSDPQFTNNPAAIGRQFHGQICEVSIFTNSLSAAQVQGLYDAAGVAPIFKTQPTSASVNQNSAYTNATVVTGSQPLTYRWYQGASLRSGQTTANLTLNPVLATDQGNYYLVASNAYGVVTSSVVSLTVFSSPTLSAPANTSMVLFAGSKPNFLVSATGAQPLFYQWRSNNVDIAGATNASFTLSNTPAGYTANIVCLVTNFVGSATTTPIAVSVITAPTAPYPAKVIADNPRGYWRLNEPDSGLSDGNPGAIAHDYWGGDNGSYTNVSLAQSPYNSTTDPTDKSAQFGLSTAFVDSYAGNIQGVDFGAPTGSVNFSVEAWVNGSGQSINGAGIVTKGFGNGGETFCFDYQPAGMRFFVRDASTTSHNCSSAVSPDFGWHHVVGVCDQSNGLVSFYIDGRLAATATITPGTGIRSSTGPMTIGSRKSNSTTTFFNNQFYGLVDDVAVYGYALSAAQVQDHYTAAGASPYFTQVPPASVSLNEGATLILPGISVGTAPLTNTWYDLNHATNVLQTWTLSTNTLSGALIVSNVPPGWSGTSLQLTAANAFGSTNVSVALNLVGGAPAFLQNLPPTVTTKVGKQYTYSIAVQGAEPFHYQWYSNNVAVAGQTSASFTFIAASANYHVVVTNIYGPSMSTVSVLTAVAAPTNNFATTLLSLNPVGYWPLQETNAPAVVTIETNLGTVGKLGNAFYAVTNADGSGVTGGSVAFGQSGALWAVGDTDSAIQVGGANAVNYAFVPRATPAVTLQPPLTLEAWVNSSSTAFGDIMGQGGSGLNAAGNAGNFGGIRMGYGGNFGGGPNLVALIYTGNAGNFNVGGTNIESTGNSLPFGQWNHCVITYDGTNVLLYANGTLQGSGTTPMAIDTWSPLTIGTGRWQAGNGTRAYTGLIDEVAIYTNVLTVAQISNHWTAGTSSGNYKQTVLNDSPTLYYRMDSAGYTTPDPLTFPTAVNYGSAPVNAAYTPGIVPGGLGGPSIAGINNSVSAPINGIISSINAGYDVSFNPTGTQPFSVMTWFKAYPSDGVVETIMGHGANWALNLDGTTGRVVWNLGSAGNVTSSINLNDGNWHLVAGVYNGSTSALYVDGVLNGSITAGSLTGDNVNVWLGGNAAFSVVGSNERNFAGALAQAAVFTNALSGPQIQQIYNASSAPAPTLSVARSGNQIVITYTGTLLSSISVTGPYLPVSGASSPYVISTPTAAQLFYRSSNP